MMPIKTWNIEAMTGYVPQTTFYEDFSIADQFGLDAIKDTFNRAFKHWKDNYVYLTELRYGIELEDLGTLRTQ